MLLYVFMRTRIPSFLFVDSQMRAPQSGPPKRLYVLMHGYLQSGKKIYDKLESLIPPDSMVLAPNGPFPIPREVSSENGSHFEVGFSWYFYNPKTDEYFIDMEIGVNLVKSLIREMKLESIPATLIGFSQGGYLAPFAASNIAQVDHVIGIGCQFLNEELSLPLRFRMDQIHGAQDDVVDPKTSQKSHQALVEAGVKGEFHLLDGTGHRIDAAVRGKLLELL